MNAQLATGQQIEQVHLAQRSASGPTSMSSEIATSTPREAKRSKGKASQP